MDLVWFHPVLFHFCYIFSNHTITYTSLCNVRRKKTSNLTEWPWTSLLEPLPLTHYTHPHWARDPRHYRSKAFWRPPAWTSISMLAGSFRNNQFNWVQMMCSLRFGKKAYSWDLESKCYFPSESLVTFNRLRTDRTAKKANSFIHMTVQLSSITKFSWWTSQLLHNIQDNLGKEILFVEESDQKWLKLEGYRKICDIFFFQSIRKIITTFQSAFQM